MLISGRLRCRIFLTIAIFCSVARSYAAHLVIEPSTTYIDALIAPYNQIKAGDTLFLKAGNWTDIQISNFKGSASSPIVIINAGGIVAFSTDHNHGISISNCQYFHLTGTGFAPEFYGIRISYVKNGTGLGIGDLSSDYEIDHLMIQNVPIAGIYAKTDPTCTGKAVRDNFTQYNTIIHDNYIENAGNEGMYVGSTRYLGQTVSCNGKDTLLMPSLLQGVKIYRNIIKNSGWDGIQVSSASKDCQVFGNQILNDSQAETASQMSGIIIGGGSKCDCYNNLITDGKGIGIENHGLGGNRIFNNIIVNAGRTYQPGDNSATKMKHGIFVSDISSMADSSVIIQNNTIINPKSDGIRFSSATSKRNLISSNVIINPGNYPVYEYGNTQFKGNDAYVFIPNKLIDVTLKNNFFSLLLSDAKLNDDYSPKINSPLIDAGFADQPYIAFDYNDRLRLPGDIPDIGAFEYKLSVGASSPDDHEEQLAIKYLNPVAHLLTIEVYLPSASSVFIQVFDKSGSRVLNKEWLEKPKGINTISIDVDNLASGLYLFTLKTSGNAYSRKFVKINHQ